MHNLIVPFGSHIKIKLDLIQRNVVFWSVISILYCVVLINKKEGTRVWRDVYYVRKPAKLLDEKDHLP
jgi:hypothetical protein